MHLLWGKGDYSMIKRLWIASVFTLMLVSLVGCSGGSYTITVGEIGTRPNEISGEYRSFSGHYFKTVKLEDGETLYVTFSEETIKGKLIAKVIDSDGNTKETLKNGDSVTISEPGQYKLQVEGEKHKGKFTIDWDFE
jgi:hypothetical protein